MMQDALNNDGVNLCIYRTNLQLINIILNVATEWRAE